MSLRLLVIDTGGINVWCSSGGGHFCSEEIMRQLNVDCPYTEARRNNPLWVFSRKNRDDRARVSNAASLLYTLPKKQKSQ